MVSTGGVIMTPQYSEGQKVKESKVGKVIWKENFSSSQCPEKFTLETLKKNQPKVKVLRELCAGSSMKTLQELS